MTGAEVGFRSARPERNAANESRGCPRRERVQVGELILTDRARERGEVEVQELEVGTGRHRMAPQIDRQVIGQLERALRETELLGRRVSAGRAGPR